jgi:hypothetical protein
MKCLLSFFLGVAAFLTACAAPEKMISEPVILKQLKQAREDWHDKKYEAIVAREKDLSCQESEEGCNQLHLIAGDACFRTAHYPCAATHLDTGIQQTKAWKFNGLSLSRTQVYVSLLESLWAMQKTKTGDEAHPIMVKLFDTAKAFHEAEPTHPAGTYFQSNAHFALLQPEIARPADPAHLCQNLNGMLEALEKTGAPPGILYLTSYRQLLSDISGAKQAVRGCL